MKKMSKIYLADSKSADKRVEHFLSKYASKVSVYAPGTCPINIQLSLLQASRSQTCGKCVPCRDGLRQLEKMLVRVLRGNATIETLDEIKSLAEMIRDSADCAIGYEAAIEVLEGLEIF